MRLHLSMLICLLPIAPALGAEPAPSAQTIAPFIDDQTVAVGWLDTNRLDLPAVEALVVELAKAVGDDEGEHSVVAQVAGFKTFAQSWLEAFHQAGGRDLYAVASLIDLPKSDKPFLVVPIYPGADAQKLAALLFSGRLDGPTGQSADATGGAYPQMTVERFGSAVVLGAGQTIARLHALKPVARPELGTALGATPDASLRIAVIPTADNRRVVEDMIPTLPKEYGGGPITVVTHGAMWITIGANTQGGVAANIVVGSQDAAAAQALHTVIDQTLAALSADRHVQKHLPTFTQIAARLRPTVRGDRLMLELNADTLRDTITRLIAPPLIEARTRAYRMMTGQSMCNLMAAIHTYANEHKNQWPESWATLLDTGAITQASLRSPERQLDFVYIRPSDPVGKVESSRMVLYEAHRQWGEGIHVAFADAHAEFIADEAKFKILLTEAMAKGTATGETTQPGTTSDQAAP